MHMNSAVKFVFLLACSCYIIPGISYMAKPLSASHTTLATSDRNNIIAILSENPYKHYYVSSTKLGKIGKTLSVVDSYHREI